MTFLEVAVIQTTSSDLDPKKTIDAGLSLVQQAATKADLIVLPELWTGLGLSQHKKPEEISQLNEYVDNALEAIARDSDCYIVGSTYREVDGLTTNTAVLVGPKGPVGSYTKTHLFDAGNRTDITNPSNESDKVAAGSELPVFDTPFGLLGVTICADLRFPEPYRVLALKGAIILINCSAFLAPRADHWEFLLRARAVENQAFVVASGQFGEEPASGTRFVGRSMVVDPWGLVIATASDREGILAASLDLDLIDATRKQFPLLEQRRPELYADVSSPVGADGLLVLRN
ncbi:carbon-nitrogen hydrolase family protein [Arthrobacter bambusae]|uniref:carbon-nitrogen hydrolase family protein n=1 Tax=Arthrobacter bambusae TaxID=1338426 RepID=UPI00278AD8A5|nr:nitrilase-related carbon-nitrogen hydrolase [Arthrobacter bambusae]MDQ0029941.1 putative amidohydrolase [Arthrobacter bambusae]MDQ0097541.1 putative amidohydrolase [Arthrobacter bambusae]